jgi:cell division septal protein FtsQ
VAVVSVDRPRTLRYGAASPEPPKRRGGSQRGLATVSLLLLLLVALAGLGWALQSDTFRVRSVQVSGASTKVRQAIEDLVAPGCSELIPGSVTCPADRLGPNELTLSASDVERQLRQIPLVKSAKANPQLPDRLAISIVERQPEAAWVVGTDVFRVADDGVVIDRGSADGLKVVVGQVAGTPVRPGDTIDLKVLRGAEYLQERLPADLEIPARRIQYSPIDGLAVVGDQDFIAMFGLPQDLNLKMAELQRILQIAKDKKTPLAFVDLRYKTPYYRLR